MTKKDLDNRVALITGAARGIGKAIAIELGKRGAIVICTDIGDKQVEEISGYMGEHKLEGHSFVMDVTDEGMIEETTKKIKECCGDVSILVNNAGITCDNLMLRMTTEQWNSVINTNLGSVYHLSKMCLRGMLKAKWGRIINIVSIVGLIGNLGQANYAAAKGGAVAFAKSLAREVATKGVTVNNVAPGFVNTQMTQNLSGEQREALLKSIPMNRVCEPEDIAYVVSFLASPKSWYITGETININGGMYMSS